MKKKLIKVLYIIVLLGIGSYLGYLKGMQDGSQKAQFATSMGYASYLGLHNQNALLQYKVADYTDAHAALLDLTEVLNHGLLNIDKDSFLTERMLYFDLGLAYARLALLEEKQDESNAMNKYFAKSLEAFESGGYENFDKEKIRDLIIRFDE